MPEPAQLGKRRMQTANLHRRGHLPRQIASTRNAFKGRKMTFTEKLKKVLCIMLGIDGQPFIPEERMTVEQIQVRVWAVVILTIAFVFASTVLIAIISLIFTIQPMLRMAPIDAIFAKQVNDAMLLSGGVLGGVAGMTFVNAGVNYVYKKLTDENPQPKAEDDAA
jgi:hypothetical protein